MLANHCQTRQSFLSFSCVSVYAAWSSRLFFTFFCLALVASPTIAEEGGSGHYFPGSIASFMDGVSPTPTLIARLNVIDYHGTMGADRAIPIAGMSALDVDVASTAVGFTAFWHPEWGKISDKWSYAMSATVPYVDLSVVGTVSSSNAPGIEVRRTDTASGVGDTVLMPLMFNYAANPDFNVNLRLAIYAPTGNYEVGKLANTGKNFWTYEPTIGLMYFGQKNGREASLFFGFDINTTNKDTDYKSGTQAHLEGTLAQHFPMWGGMAGLGVTGYWYQQVNGDSGSGATFGDFKAKAHGAGPVISFVKVLGKAQLLTELKWEKEFDVEKRTEGDFFFLKVMYKFY